MILIYRGRDKDPQWDPRVFDDETAAKTAAAEQGLTDRHVQWFGRGGKVPNPMHPEWLKLAIKRGYFIPIEKLQDGAWYVGHCRNACLAQWDAKRKCFVYRRREWGTGPAYPETVFHPENDVGWDVFVPEHLAEQEPVIPDLRGTGIGNGIREGVE